MALTPYVLPVVTGGDGKKRARKDQHEAAINAIAGQLDADKLDSTLAALTSLTDTADAKTTPVDGDGLILRDSAASFIIRRISWANIKAALKTYFDGIYMDSTLAALTSLTDTADAKTTPVDGDGLILRDSAASFLIRRISWANIKAALKTYFDGIYMAELDERIPSVSDVSNGFIPLHVALSTDQVAVWLESGLLSAKGMAPGLRRQAVADIITSLSTGGYSTQPVGGVLPLVLADQKAVVWLDNGDLDARGISPSLRAKAVADIVNRVSATGELIPVLTAGASVIAWIDDTGLEFAKLSANQNAKLKTALSPYFGSRVSPQTDGDMPTATDGRTLSRWRAKLAALNRGVAGTRINIGFTGDSWSELNTIPLEFRQWLGDAFGIAGDGFRSVAADDPAYTMDPSVVVTRSGGWTLVDGSTTITHPYGSGPDGQSVYTTGASETFSLANLVATDMKIFYRNHGGTFRWSVDGGTWTTVTSDSSGGFGMVSITGLSDAAHTLSIDTTGNAGTVSLCGFYSRRSASGAVVVKFGNAGLRGDYMHYFVPYIAEPLTEMDVDLVAIFLGTNDYRASSATPAKYADALREAIDAYRQARPDIGIVLVAPSRSNGVTANPLYLYRNAAYQVAIEKGVEFLNLYDQWGTNAESVALGMWESGLHVNATGATDIKNLFNENFLKVRA